MKRFVFCVFAVSVSGAVFAQNLLGADEVLKRMGVKEKGGLSSNAVRAEISRFASSMGSLPPAEAGRRWVDLAVEAMDMKPTLSDMGILTNDVMKALPPPESWPAIALRAEELAKRGKPDLKMLALRMLGHVLTGNVSAQWNDLKAMQALESGPESTDELEMSLALQFGDATRITKALDQRIKRLKAAYSEMPESGLSQSASVPDLVASVGEATARKIYEHLLKTSDIPLSFESGKSQEVARKTAESILPQIKAPQFDLTCSLDGGKLYDGLRARFPKVKLQKQNDALAWMVLRAIYAGKGASVVGSIQALQGMYYELPQQLKGKKAAANAKLLADYLHLALPVKPELSLWDTYQTTSLLSGQGPRAIADMQAVLAKPNLKPETVWTIRSSLARTLLGTDKIEEGIAMLRKVSSGKDQGYSAIQLALLGQALGRPALVEEGLTLAKASSDTVAYAANFLIEIGRFGDAERLLADKFDPTAEGYSYAGAPGPTWMRSLVYLYYSSKRYEDVVALLDHSPYWGASELGELGTLLTDSETVGYFRTQPQLGPMIAESLLRTGHRDQADKLVGWLLDQDASYDPTFALLLEIRGDAAMPLLDELAARNRYQERPLIWKAKLLLNQKKLDEAEATIRKAISIDPSDGETTGGHRMYAYTVLAEILDAQGKASDAETMRSAVRAIRLSEKGDDMLQAGLVNRALKLYGDSLKIFSDAYCIQSRMAVQLASEGRYAEAAEHYRRAFELMPDSFGEMETHCFGCEGVFTTGPAEQIAEQVFEELVQKTPNKPQVHYLLGYLREEQGRKAEAYKHFARAAELDPYYINAWLHMLANANTQAETKLPSANLIKLDPLGRIATTDIDVQVVGLAETYRAAQAALPPAAKNPEFYRLPMSKPDEGRTRTTYLSEVKIESPGESVARSSLIKKIVNLLAPSRYYG